MPANMEREERDRMLDVLNERRIPFQSYEFVKNGSKMVQLGEGGFAIVYEGRNRNVSVSRAIKTIGFMAMGTDQKDVEQFAKEVKLQSELAEQCINVVQIEDANSVYVKFGEKEEIEDLFFASEARENVEGYRLFQFILMEKLSSVFGVTKNGQPVIRIQALKDNEQEILKFAIDIGNALTAAHRKKVAHRDVKLENTFYEERSKTYKLGDFGIARVTENGQASTKAGTRGNIAPEAELGDNYDGYKADIYSFGIMLYLLLNNLRYPGSKGYKPNREVQYNPGIETLPNPERGAEKLIKIVLKACSYHAEERYDSMEELIADLREVQVEKTSTDSNASDETLQASAGVVQKDHAKAERAEDSSKKAPETPGGYDYSLYLLKKMNDVAGGDTE